MADQKLSKAPQSRLRRVPFSVQAEGAREVTLTGEFTQWAQDKVRLLPAGNGKWQTTLELAPGVYQYRLLVDGQWRDNPAETKRVPNAFGTQNCVLTVS